MSAARATGRARLAASPADRAAAFEIRRQVFLTEQKVPEEMEFDAEDDRATHAVAEVDGRIVGTARLVLHPDHARIGRMAVLPGSRRHGLGRELLELLVRQARDAGAAQVLLHAQVQAIGFYERGGFVAFGETFDEAGIPHRKMRKAL